MRDSQLYVPSSLRHKLSLIARKRKEGEQLVYDAGTRKILREVNDTADSVGVELLEWAIAQKHPKFAAGCAEQEDRDKQLMELI